MGNKSLKNRIKGCQEQIDIHKEKIRLELKKEVPDYDRIHHWESEIKAFEKSLNGALKRLGKL